MSKLFPLPVSLSLSLSLSLSPCKKKGLHVVHARGVRTFFPVSSEETIKADRGQVLRRRRRRCRLWTHSILEITQKEKGTS